MKGALTVAAVVALAGCASLTAPLTPSGRATADLRTGGGQPAGRATFVQIQDSVRVLLEVRGLPPGPHGVHIHEVGACDGPQFTSAGGHFNPGQTQHGALNPRGPHAGDLPNIVIGADGTGRLETSTDRITLGAGASSLFDANGSALVVHTGADDFTTDPTGNSGGRLACGVIVKQER